MKQKTNDKIKLELREVYGDSVLSLSIIKYWIAEFKHSHRSIYDDKHPGYSTKVMNQ